MAGKATRYVRDATPPSLSVAISSTRGFRLLSLAVIMASATPGSSEGGTSITARAARGVRGLHHDTESPHVADAGIEAQRIGSSLMSSSFYLRTAHVPRLDLEAIIYPHVHAPKYILHRLSRSYTDQSFLSCATHRNVLSLDVAKGRRYCWRRCFRFGRKVAEETPVGGQVGSSWKDPST